MRKGSPKAAQVIWNPLPGAAAAASAHSTKRRDGLLRAAVAAAIGAALFGFASTRVGGVVLGIAALVAFAALVSPLGLYAALERLLAATARLAGRAMAWLLLVPVFYLFFLPFGALFRRGRRDRLRRFFDAEAGSYWTDREERPASSPAHQY